MKTMIEKATEALQHAYAPYSHTSVGVCIRSEKNQLFSGCNVENAAYPTGQCAEANAIGAMIVSGHRQIKEMVLITQQKAFVPPCGACRQRLSEFASPDTLIHLYNIDGLQKAYTLGELLPLPFQSKFLESL